MRISSHCLQFLVTKVTIFNQKGGFFFRIKQKGNLLFSLVFRIDLLFEKIRLRRYSLENYEFFLLNLATEMNSLLSKAI